MADNLQIPAGTGPTVATDDVAGVAYQRVKVNFGADGSASDVSAANPLPVSTGLPGPAALSDASVNPSAPIVGSANLLYNEATGAWVRARCSSMVNLLPAADRTATTGSPLQTNYNYKGVLLRFNVATAGTGTIAVVLLQHSNTFVVFDYPGTVGLRSYLVYPNKMDMASSLGKAVGGNFADSIAWPLLSNWGARITHTDSSVWNYTLDAFLLS